MSFEFNLPNFQVETQSERKMYSYLYQTVQQLNWAMKHIQTAESAGVLPGIRTPESGKSAAEKTPAETFSEIKALIIKSADIVNAYYDTINARLEGLYVAQSEFGDYVEATELELEANSEGIQQNYTNIQGIQTDLTGLSGTVSGATQDIAFLEGAVSTAQNDLSQAITDLSTTNSNLNGLKDDLNALNTVVVSTNAYIRTGKLGEDEYGIPIYGLEIGQTNEVNEKVEFSKYARFSSSKLSFYDQNDTEVAYISDYKLYITNAEVTGSLTIAGKFKIYSGPGLVFQWIGGN